MERKELEEAYRHVRHKYVELSKYVNELEADLKRLHKLLEEMGVDAITRKA